MSEPVFVLATTLRPGEAAWELARAQAAQIQESLTRPLGTRLSVDLACLPFRSGNGPEAFQIPHVIDRHAAAGATEIFVLPATFELDIWQRSMLGEEIIEARRRHRAASIHHDTVDPSYPLLVDCFGQAVMTALSERGISPQQAGVMLVPAGQGDPGSRADSYRLMRLIWETTGVAKGEVGFLQHPKPSLQMALERCLPDSHEWLLLPQCQWQGELSEYAGVILSDFQRAHPAARNWRVLEPPGNDAAVSGWLEHRMRRLWQEKRARQAVRAPSAKREAAPAGADVWTGDGWAAPTAATAPATSGFIARAGGPEPLADILKLLLPPADRYLIKVTWHGYATGTFTGPTALDWLLSALPGKAIILEGHTSGRNLGGLEIDWESGTEAHRAWIRQQEIEYLRRTGVSEVLARHGAQYLNVTEAWWDGDCAPPAEVLHAVGDVPLTRPELAGFVPAALLELRGTPCISFARFKGPTRLAISNMFGLIPHPLRTEWHGTGIPDFAAACCDMARIYGSLFPMFGLVEGFETAVRWDRKGLYRSRWGNYDLVSTNGLFTASEGLVAADILASRVQGQDVRRSGFYSVVRDRLGWSDEAEALPLPAEIVTNLV